MSWLILQILQQKIIYIIMAKAIITTLVISAAQNLLPINHESNKFS